MTVIPPDPGVARGAQYLTSALAHRTDIDNDAVHRKVQQLTHPRPGIERDEDIVMLDIARPLWQGQSWEDVVEQLPSE